MSSVDKHSGRFAAQVYAQGLRHSKAPVRSWFRLERHPHVGLFNRQRCEASQHVPSAAEPQPRCAAVIRDQHAGDQCGVAALVHALRIAQ